MAHRISAGSWVSPMAVLDEWLMDGKWSFVLDPIII